MAAIREQWWIPQLSEAPESYSNFPIAEVSYGGEQTVSIHWSRLRRTTHLHARIPSSTKAKPT